MDNKVKNQLLNELENLTIVMNVPIDKQKNPHWLLENVTVNNKEHKNVDKVIKISNLLVKEERQ